MKENNDTTILIGTLQSNTNSIIMEQHKRRWMIDRNAIMFASISVYVLIYLYVKEQCWVNLLQFQTTINIFYW